MTNCKRYHFFPESPSTVNQVTSRATALIHSVEEYNWGVVKMTNQTMAITRKLLSCASYYVHKLWIMITTYKMILDYVQCIMINRIIILSITLATSFQCLFRRYKRTDNFHFPIKINSSVINKQFIRTEKKNSSWKKVQKSIEHFGAASRFAQPVRRRYSIKCNKSENWFQSSLIQRRTRLRGQFPYFALIIADFDHLKITCGGSLIHPQWVLTGAYGALSYEVHLGALTLKNVTEPGCVVINATSAFYHPLMFLPLQLHDIGLIRLDRPVQLSDTIQTIALETLDLPANTSLTTIGFGRFNKTDFTLAPILQYAPLYSIANKWCGETLPFARCRRSVMCAVGSKMESPCVGDSGGPLVRANAESPRAPTLVGVHFGTYVCHSDAPAAFTRVAYYNRWIQHTIKNHSK